LGFDLPEADTKPLDWTDREVMRAAAGANLAMEAISLTGRRRSGVTIGLLEVVLGGIEASTWLIEAWREAGRV